MLNLRRWEKRKRTYLTKLVNWLIERLSLFGVINHNLQTTTSNALHMKCCGVPNTTDWAASVSRSISKLRIYR